MNYALGSDNQDLPTFVVMSSGNAAGVPIDAAAWGSGFLPSHHKGVLFRSGDNPVPYVNNPDGLTLTDRRAMLDLIGTLSKAQNAASNDPDILSRVSQYEMSYRMQASVPGIMDVSNETDETFDLYGKDSRTPGTFAANCLLARRLAERGVKFIQLYHQGWDQHDNLPKNIQVQCRETDKASAALVTDLKRRGLLDDTLVVWGGEFGRTSYSQGTLTATNYGRDHHPRCFTVWMAGGGVKPGLVYGYPCTTKGGKYEIVQGLSVDAFSRARMDATEKELREERAAIEDLLKA